jgi:tRNA(Glu) U13 pseudouridine synthase TruD
MATRTWPRGRGHEDVGTQLATDRMQGPPPFITADLPGIGPGIGGEIKAEPAHFVVEEIPLYKPTGEGEHVYVCLAREGWTTRALKSRLAELFGLRDADVGADIGCAGLKDRCARATRTSTQTFSLLLRDPDETTVARRIQEALPVEVVWARRHRNKLRAGRLDERIRRGWFGRLLTGDIAKRTDTGGLFEVADAAVELPRFERGGSPTPGRSTGEPGELERRVMEAADVTPEMLRRARLDGSRRPARLLLDGLSVARHPDGLLFAFALPKGAYATTVLREFMKAEGAWQGEREAG